MGPPMLEPTRREARDSAAASVEEWFCLPGRDCRGSQTGMTHDKDSEARRRALRGLAKAAAGDVVLPAADVLWLLDECGRLQQGNDRLRRQNRRLRLRAQRDGGAPDEEPGDDVGEDAV